MKSLLNFVALLMVCSVFAQKNAVYKINYDNYSNGKKSDRSTSILVSDNIVYLSDANDQIKTFINYNEKITVSTILYEGQLYKHSTSFADLPESKMQETSDKIMGYTCKKVSYSYFSNSIVVWYTDKAKVAASPNSSYVPSETGLVLKMVTNGNREVLATSVEKVKDAEIPEYLPAKAKEVTAAELEEIKINSRFKRLPIFEDEVVNFDPSLKVPERKDLQNNVTYRFSKGSVIMKKVKLTEELNDGGQIFAKLHCRSNGDAYDRTGSVFIIPETTKKTILDGYLDGTKALPQYIDNKDKVFQGVVQTEDYDPPVEIIRFFTSFGADHFNDKRVINNYNWANDVVYKEDVTTLIPLGEQEIWVGVFVGNYDKGGHKVSLELDFYPGFGGSGKSFEKYIDPLFSTVNTMEMSGQNYGRMFKNDTLKVDFELDEGVNGLNLVYTSTGHGGWGRGDEFVPKMNQIFIDGEKVFSVVPWRTDCATYRMSNPASGNFGNGLSSSDLSRSNWCPGTLTPPYLIPLKDLKPGKHTIEVVIDQGEDEGSSFSHWSVTGILTGYKVVD